MRVEITDVQFSDQKRFWELFRQFFTDWPENNYFGNSAGADCIAVIGNDYAVVFLVRQGPLCGALRPRPHHR